MPSALEAETRPSAPGAQGDEPLTESPFFSVLVSTYNRAKHLERCVGSILGQSFTDFEVVVVDDASTDRTAEALAGLAHPRLRTVRHRRNRGISPTRATAVAHARGEWLVMVDSDWELLPHTLARLHTLIGELPPGVRMIRSRLQSDDGSVQPGVMPSGVTGYHDRLLWLEQIALHRTSSDAGHCIHRSVFETANYFEDRRGAMEALWETNLARREPSLWVPDILAKQHLDAPNSHSRDAHPNRVIPRLLREARDELWMAERMLAEHGRELASYAPNVRLAMIERAAQQAFLSGDRRAGLRHAVSALKSGSRQPRFWFTMVLGLVGRRPLAYAKLASRRRQAALLTAGTDSGT